jgi:hypothetical protein
MTVYRQILGTIGIALADYEEKNQSTYRSENS